MEGRIFRLSQLSEKTSLQTRYNSMLAGNPSFIPISGSYEPLASITVPSGGMSSVTFGSIPQTYAHLQIRIMAINTTIPNGGDVYMRFNNDLSSSYNAHYLYGNGSGSASAGVLTQTYVYAAFNASSSPGNGIVDILDYTNTNKNKTVRSLMGNDRNGAGDIALTSGVYLKTNAITDITIFPGTSNFAANSSFALYGIKG